MAICKKCEADVMAGTEYCITHLLEHVQAENAKFKNLIRNALRIKDLWFSQSDEPEQQEESYALAAMLHHFEDALEE